MTEQGSYSGLTVAGEHRDTEGPGNPLLTLGVAHLHQTLTSVKDGFFLLFSYLSPPMTKECMKFMVSWTLVTHSDVEARRVLLTSLFTRKVELRD